VIRLTEAARFYRELPHQIAAWTALQAKVPPEALQEFEELYRSAPAVKQELPPAWLAPALRIIREFEGCRLDAYKDAAGVATIGWGATRYADAPVRMGDTITQAMADEMLTNDVETLFGPGVFELLPVARSWKPEQVAAIVCFAYNVGLGALEESTLRRRLLAGGDACTIVREELPKWCHAGEAVLAGLERRRASTATPRAPTPSSRRWPATASKRCSGRTAPGATWSSRSPRVCRCPAGSCTTAPARSHQAVGTG